MGTTLRAGLVIKGLVTIKLHGRHLMVTTHLRGMAINELETIKQFHLGIHHLEGGAISIKEINIHSYRLGTDNLVVSLPVVVPNQGVSLLIHIPHNVVVSYRPG